MGIPNKSIRCVNTGHNHLCFPNGYAPEKIVVKSYGVERGPAWHIDDPSPGDFTVTLYYLGDTVYRGYLGLLRWDWDLSGGINLISVWSDAGHVLGGGQNTALTCPIYYTGVFGTNLKWVFGRYELKIRQECFFGPHPWDTGDLAVVPQDADMFSEVQNVTEDSQTVRFARHRDGSNILIKQNL